MGSELGRKHVNGTRSSSVGNLIKTKSGKMFLQKSSKGKNSTKKDTRHNDDQRQETGHGLDEYPQVSIIEWVKRDKNWRGQ